MAALLEEAAGAAEAPAELIPPLRESPQHKHKDEFETFA